MEDFIQVFKRWLSPWSDKIISCLSHCGDDAELLHHGQLVDHAPVFVGQPVIAKASDVNEVYGNWITRRRNASEITHMGPAYPQTGNSLVAARKRVLNVHSQIWKRVQHNPEILDDAVFRWWDARYLFVFDEVISNLLAETINVTGVDKVVEALN
jgi:hypothetical protein